LRQIVLPKKISFGKLLIFVKVTPLFFTNNEIKKDIVLPLNRLFLFSQKGLGYVGRI